MVVIKLEVNYIVFNALTPNVWIVRMILIHVNYVKLLMFYITIAVLFKVVNKWEHKKNVKNVFKVMSLIMRVFNVKSLIAIKQNKLKLGLINIQVSTAKSVMKDITN